MSKFYKKSEESLKTFYQRILKQMGGLGLFIAIIMILFANRIIPLILGREYMTSIIIFQILIWSKVFVFLSLTCAYLLRAMNKQITDAKITGG